MIYVKSFVLDSEYTGPIKLYIVPFTRIQTDIIEKCREDELTIIMRRFMMKLAELVAVREGAKALVTGESLGQVASQTLDSIFVPKHPKTRPSLEGIRRSEEKLDAEELMEEALEKAEVLLVDDEQHNYSLQTNLCKGNSMYGPV